MRSVPAALAALLASRQPLWSADLFTFTLRNGTVLRLASTDIDITFGGITWTAANAGSVGITRGPWAIKNTIDVPSLEIDIVSSGTDYAGGANIKLAIHDGLLDGAGVTLQRVFAPASSSSGALASVFQAIWARVNIGDWNGDPAADPTAGVGGIPLLGMAGPYFPVGGLNTGFFGGQLLTFAFGGPFTETSPPGALAWGGATTLNPADKNAAITLASGNLSMSLGGEVTGALARATTSNATQGGLRYFEAVMATAAQNWAVGLANAAASLTSGGGVFNDPGLAVLRDDGTIVVNGAIAATLSPIAAGDIMCIATGPATLLGLVPVLTGNVGQVVITSTGAKITVRGGNVRMNQYMPRNRFLTGCVHSLYDVGCALNRASFTFAGTVSAAGATTVNWTTDPTSGHFANLALGTITITSGAAAGQTRSIAFSASTGVGLMYPLYVLPAPGDTFSVSYGCDKTRDGANGCAFFANQAHFRGFRFVPAAETAAVA
jgi:hypothetical protein